MHSVATSAASVADKHMLPGLLHGDELKVRGDGCYRAIPRRSAQPRPRRRT